MVIHSFGTLTAAESVRIGKLRYLPYYLFSGACVLYLFLSPATAADAAGDALSVCARSVIPSLFPFIIVNSIVVDSGFASVLGSWMGRPVKVLFAVNAAGAAAFVLGALSGFPLGAQCAGRLYEQGLCTKDDAERMLAFCNNTGPSFLIGTIGAYMWGMSEIGILLYASQMISAVVVGFALRFTRKEEPLPPFRSADDLILNSSVFTSAISRGSVTMLKICGFITAFSVLCAMLREFAVMFGLQLQGAAAALIFGFLEITAGAGASAAAGGRIGLALTAAAVGWSGLSVHMQTASVIDRKGLSMKRYIIGKAAQGILSGLIAFAGAPLLFR